MSQGEQVLKDSAKHTWWLRWQVTLVFIVLVTANIQMFTIWSLGDFEVTFYHSANYLLRGENVYLSPYTHPTNGREYPPFNPIWITYAIVPISVFPLKTAEAIRYFIDLAAIPFLAYLCAKWARLDVRWCIVLLALAPWHFVALYSGQWTVAVLLGTLVCYWGVSRKSAPATAIGLWLMLMKFQIALLIILGTVLFAWRIRILFKTAAILVALILVFSIPQPTWSYDLFILYGDRLQHPRLADSILLLPGYPWAQAALLTAGALFLIVYLQRSRPTKPEPWLWAALVGLGLVGAVHTFTYDWMMLMLPLAWLLRDRRMGFLVGGLYAFPSVWTSVALLLHVPLHFAFVNPGMHLMSVIWFFFMLPLVWFLRDRHGVLVMGVIGGCLLAWGLLTWVLQIPMPSLAIVPGAVVVMLIISLLSPPNARAGCMQRGGMLLGSLV